MSGTAGYVDEALVACDVCLREIPQSEADIVEANDYVMYFCGLDCYKKWRTGASDIVAE